MSTRISLSIDQLATSREYIISRELPTMCTNSKHNIFLASNVRPSKLFVIKPLKCIIYQDTTMSNVTIFIAILCHKKVVWSNPLYKNIASLTKAAFIPIFKCMVM